MRMVFLTALFALLPILAPAAERFAPLAKKAQPSGALRSAKGNPCAAYGAGFVQVEGTSTCVKIGGSMRVEFGSGPRR